MRSKKSVDKRKDSAQPKVDWKADLGLGANSFILKFLRQTRAQPAILRAQGTAFRQDRLHGHDIDAVDLGPV
jgi:hypothetical protein